MLSTMTYQERYRLVREIGDYVIKKLKEEELSKQQHWVRTAEAASILGVTPKYLRSIKDRFPHTKAGDSPQGSLLFLKEALVENYVNNG